MVEQTGKEIGMNSREEFLHVTFLKRIRVGSLKSTFSSPSSSSSSSSSSTSSNVHDPIIQARGMEPDIKSVEGQDLKDFLNWVFGENFSSSGENQGAEMTGERRQRENE